MEFRNVVVVKVVLREPVEKVLVTPEILQESNGLERAPPVTLQQLLDVLCSIRVNLKGVH